MAVEGLNPPLSEPVPKRKHKYNAKKVEDDGYVFDSKAEHRRYLQLKELKVQGVIRNLEVHPQKILLPAFLYGDERVRKVSYEADFQYFDTRDGLIHIEDAKGAHTRKDPLFRVKWKMLQYQLRDRGDIVMEIVEP